MRRQYFIDKTNYLHMYKVTFATKRSIVKPEQVKKSKYGIVLSHEQGNERAFIVYNHPYNLAGLNLKSEWLEVA